MIITSFHFLGPDYIKQRFNEPIEPIVQEEKKEKTPSSSPHFYRKGTTPDNSPTASPQSSPPPTPPSTHTPEPKKSFFSKLAPKPGKENKTPAAESQLPVITKAVSKTSLQQEVRQEVPPQPKTFKMAESVPVSPGNGQLHTDTEYHGYYVKADVKIPQDEPEDVDEHVTPSALTRMPPPAKPMAQYRTPTPKPIAPKSVSKESKPESRLKKLDSYKPRSLAETRKQASLEITTDFVEEESVSNSYCMMMKMGKLKQRERKVSFQNNV